MSDLKTILLKEASILRSSSPELVAVGMLKQAGFSEADARTAVAKELITKEATSALLGKGFDPEEAAKLVKAAEIDLSALGVNPAEATDAERTAALLEKAAAQIEELEGRAIAAEAEVEIVKQASEEANKPVPASIEKWAQSGAFTNEDLAALRALPETTLQKVAASTEEPWSMGKAAGASTGGYGDPLTDFLMG